MRYICVTLALLLAALLPQPIETEAGELEEAMERLAGEMELER